MTQYVTFQVFTSSGDPKRPPDSDHCTTPPSRETLAQFLVPMREQIGTTGDARRKLGFALGPISFDHTDAEVLTLIQDGFALAKWLNLAVAFHIDDSMFWGRRAVDLVSGSSNVEWRGWDKTPNTGRRLDWGPQPTKLPPQMDYTAGAIRTIANARATLIGTEIARNVSDLVMTGRGHLYAGTIAGWETQLGRDFESGDELGYAAMTRWGFTANNPPADLAKQRADLVLWWMQLWARRLRWMRVPGDKLYCHVALETPGLGVAFDVLYRPGFSTYPQPGMFETIHTALAMHSNPVWASCEGTNVVPDGSFGEPTMESYLAKHFNYGAGLVNLFGWGIGDDPTNIFRYATENDEAVESYRKFLRGEALTEAP